jgi:hypothetical protein
MKLEQYLTASAFLQKKELEKIKLLAFYHLRKNDKTEFSLTDIIDWFKNLNLAEPNTGRLRKNLRDSPWFVKGASKDGFKLHAKPISELSAQYPDLKEEDEGVASLGTVLPHDLYAGTRGYVESLSRQINASYENNIFDGCAVLMRRLLEILLIQSYENHGIDGLIKDQNGYVDLNKIILNSINNKNLNLSKDTKNCLDDFRLIGNFSAHKIHYNCRKDDLKKNLLIYRCAIEELLYKSGLKK